jgi:hypothetical protein
LQKVDERGPKVGERGPEVGGGGTENRRVKIENSKRGGRRWVVDAGWRMMRLLSSRGAVALLCAPSSGERGDKC